MFCIHLKDLRFRSYHGIYPAEQLLGNDFIVQLKVYHAVPLERVHEIEQCLNYENLFALVKGLMDVPTPLLETIAMDICSRVLSTFAQVQRIWVSIEKCNPPIPGLQGSVVVELEQQRS